MTIFAQKSLFSVIYNIWYKEVHFLPQNTVLSVFGTNKFLFWHQQVPFLAPTSSFFGTNKLLLCHQQVPFLAPTSSFFGTNKFLIWQQVGGHQLGADFCVWSFCTLPDGDSYKMVTTLKCCFDKNDKMVTTMMNWWKQWRTSDKNDKMVTTMNGSFSHIGLWPARNWMDGTD